MATTSARRDILHDAGATFTPTSQPIPRRTPAGRRGGGMLKRLTLAPPVAPPKPSAIVAAEQLELLQPLIEQTIGVLILFIGLNGSIQALNNEFINWLAVPLIFGGSLATMLCLRLIPRRMTRLFVMLGLALVLLAANDVFNLVKLWAIAGGLAFQAVVTLFQWTYCRNKSNPRYLGAVAADASLNVRGYGMVLRDPLMSVLAMLGFSAISGYTSAIAWGIISIFSVIVAVAGEHILVKK